MIVTGSPTSSDQVITGKPAERDRIALGSLQTDAADAVEAVVRRTRRAQRRDQQSQWLARSEVCWPPARIERETEPAKEPGT